MSSDINVSKGLMLGNFFENLPDARNQEIFETIIASKNVVIERITTYGQTTEQDKWYEQEQDEWVILIAGSAEIMFYDGKIVKMQKGDYIFIPSRLKHRVEKTSLDELTLWLAIHIH